MVTSTPIPWFLSLPLDGLLDWAETVRGIQAEDAPPGSG